MHNGTATLERSVAVPYKIKPTLTIQLILLFSVYPGEVKTQVYTESYMTAVLFGIVKNLEAPEINFGK